jgi:hypothetical protein
MIPVMNLALVVGVAVVLPLALGRPLRAWLGAAAAVALSLSLPPGIGAAAFVAPWVALTIVAGVDALRRRAWWEAVAAGFAGTASLALVASRLEVTLFGILEPIVKLTALHFTYAGAGTLALAHRLAAERPSQLARLARWLAVLAPPVVASGFVLRSAVGQVGGAVLMTAAVWLVAALQLTDVRLGTRRGLWALSSASPLVAMVLGVSWAANQYWPQVPALSVPDMVPTHGALNAFGFVLCGLVAARAPHRAA